MTDLTEPFSKYVSGSGSQACISRSVHAVTNDVKKSPARDTRCLLLHHFDPGLGTIRVVLVEGYTRVITLVEFLKPLDL